MSDYLGPLTLGETGTYQLLGFEPGEGAASLEVKVTALTSDALTAAIEALAAELRSGNSYAHTFPGATLPVVFRITGVTSFRADTREGPLNFWSVCTASLTVEAAPAGALTTLFSAQHVDAPASLSLATLLGTLPPALDLTVDDDSGNDLHCVICALAPAAVTDAKWLILANALTWTTLTPGTGSDCWGNVCGTTTSADWQTAPLDASSYPGGKYRLYARLKMSGGTGYLMDSQNGVQVAVTRTSMHLVPMGSVDLPTADSAPGTAANLTLSVQSDGSHTLTLNGFLLIPTWLGSWVWHHDTVTGECDQLDFGPSGRWVDGVADATYFRGVVLVPEVLAAHVPTLVATASPSGSTWPTDWGRTDSTDVTADSSTFKVATTAGEKYASFAATNAATPLVVPGEWYELSFLRSVSARSAGAAVALVRWQDVDGNTVREDTLSTTSATDAAPVTVTVYARAPVHAARAQVRLGAGSGANLTAGFSAVVLRRCPLRLIVVAEEAGGTLVSNVHPVHLTARYQALYEVAR